eukprot:Clim_evm41s108 gene=Clim_evmTU41s108
MLLRVLSLRAIVTTSLANANVTNGEIRGAVVKVEALAQMTQSLTTAQATLGAKTISIMDANTVPDFVAIEVESVRRLVSHTPLLANNRKTVPSLNTTSPVDRSQIAVGAICRAMCNRLSAMDAGQYFDLESCEEARRLWTYCCNRPHYFNTFIPFCEILSQGSTLQEAEELDANLIVCWNTPTAVSHHQAVYMAMFFKHTIKVHSKVSQTVGGKEEQEPPDGIAVKEETVEEEEASVAGSKIVCLSGQEYKSLCVAVFDMKAEISGLSDETLDCTTLQSLDPLLDTLYPGDRGVRERTIPEGAASRSKLWSFLMRGRKLWPFRTILSYPLSLPGWKAFECSTYKSHCF